MLCSVIIVLFLINTMITFWPLIVQFHTRPKGYSSSTKAYTTSRWAHGSYKMYGHGQTVPNLLIVRSE